MLVGLVGLVIPIFPGTLVIWLAALGYGLIKGFDTLGIVIFVVLTVLMIVSLVIDNLLMGAGARNRGASWYTTAIALVAGILGTIFFPPLGGLIAAPLSILLFEFMRLKNLRQAWSAFIGLAAGWGVSFFVVLTIGLLMVLLWAIWVWYG
jgi:uncharacterized protein YqgC (DUF456 family)